MPTRWGATPRAWKLPPTGSAPPAQLKETAVPHKSSGDARTSVMSGQVEMMLDAITTMASTAKSGRVRALATTGKKRSTILPDVPTVSEAGVPGYEAPIWIGMMAPRATPRPVIDRLNAEIMKIVARPEVKKAWAEQGAEPLTMTPGEFEKYLNDDIAKWAKVIQGAGIKVD